MAELVLPSKEIIKAESETPDVATGLVYKKYIRLHYPKYFMQIFNKRQVMQPTMTEDECSRDGDDRAEDESPLVEDTLNTV